MNIAQALILGVVQGFTEFLPVSSSGHLVILQKLFGLKGSQLLFNCSVHMGTLLAVMIFFFRDIKKIFISLIRLKKNDPDFLFGIHIILASIPTAIIAFTFMGYFEKAFSSALIAGVMLCITGIFLGITKFFPEKEKKQIGTLRSFAIGTAQGIAIIPGISRSGATIVCGLACGLERTVAFKFSFLLSIPAILGAFLIEVIKINQMTNITSVMVGTISSAITGIIALRILARMVKKGQLYYFSPYCLLIGGITIIGGKRWV